MRFRLVSANDKNVEIRDCLEGFGWVFWIGHDGGGRALTWDGMNVLSNKQGETPAKTLTLSAFAFAQDQARERGVTS